jgi:hypothetical protein
VELVLELSVAVVGVVLFTTVALGDDFPAYDAAAT